MNKKEIIISVVASVVAVFVILIAIGLYRQKLAPVSDYRPTPAIVSPQLKQDTAVKPDNRERYRGDFMEGCLISESLYDYCTCAYDYLYDEYGTSALVEVVLDPDSAETDAIFDDIADHCVHLFK